MTLFLREGQQSLWENGIFQNCYFLLLALQKSPHIERCFIVNGGPGDPAQAGGFLATAPAPVIDLSTAMETLDIVIELSAQLAPAWGQQFVEKGGRIVGMRVANDFFIDNERMVFGMPPAMLMSCVPYHEIWTLPSFVRTCASYYQTGFRARCGSCNISGARISSTNDRQPWLQTSVPLSTGQKPLAPCGARTQYLLGQDLPVAHAVV